MTTKQNTNQEISAEEQQANDAWDEALSSPESEAFLKEASEKALKELENEEGLQEL